MEKVTRQRLKPRIYDFCYFTCRNNLRGLNNLKQLAAKNQKKNSKKLRILDVGCGVKPFQTFFPNAEYIGIDFTKEKTKADKIVDLNNEKIPFASNSFDVVIVSETMEHVFNNLNLVNEMKRVTKKDGYLFVSTPFQFHEHGDPHDYFRFTEYYYKMMFKDMTLVKSSGSNSLFTTPILAANVILEPIPVLSHIFITINNLIGFLTELLGNIIKGIFSSNERIVRYINGSFVGCYFIFKKK
jgi:2-polyprenyl-3-methyl-5-hydroxy-6-metoxy-1,4-benzoquinol methylase